MELEEIVEKHKKELIENFIKPYVNSNIPIFVVRDYLDDYWYEVEKLYLKDDEVYARELWLDEETHEVSLLTQSYDELLFISNKLRQIRIENIVDKIFPKVFPFN